MSSRNGRTRKEKDVGIQKGHAPGVEGNYALGRPETSYLNSRGEARMEESPEEGEEEHHLGNNEENKAKAKTPLNGSGMATLKGSFANDIAPPKSHRVEQGKKTVGKEIKAIGVTVHKKSSPQYKGKSTPSRKERPGAGGNHMEGVIFFSTIGEGESHG